MSPDAISGTILPDGEPSATAAPPTPGPADGAAQERIGVYVCHCGTNIAGTVDVAAVRDWAAERLAGHGVVVARDYEFMCSSTGQELIEKDIHDLGLTRVVVAACSPHMHEKTFRGACERAGLNPYLCELVSIREQVSWVHTDHAAATAKAKAVVAGGVLRVAQQVPLEPYRVPINPATLVVGGGIAGISAALEIADAGFPVHLVEREPSIGGHMAQFDKTFPTLDCAACILTPKMVTAGSHPEHHAPHLERGDRRRRATWATSRSRSATGHGTSTPTCARAAGSARRSARPRSSTRSSRPASATARPSIRRSPRRCPGSRSSTATTASTSSAARARPASSSARRGPSTSSSRPRTSTLQVGNIVLATGFDPFDARRIEAYGYGRLAERLHQPRVRADEQRRRPDERPDRPARRRHRAAGRRHRPLRRQPRSQLQPVLLGDLLHAEPEVRPPRPRAHRREGLRVLHRHAHAREGVTTSSTSASRTEGTVFVRGRVAEVTDVLRCPTRRPRTAG